MLCAKTAFAILVLIGSLLGAEPAIGTWKLNVTKSKYSPGPPPKSAIFTYDTSGDGIKRTGKTVNADGQTISFEYTAQYDGKDYPIKGNPNADTVSLKRVNDRTVEATLKKNGRMMSKASRVVSSDGKTLTLTITGTNAQGQRINNVTVYEKQ